MIGGLGHPLTYPNCYIWGKTRPMLPVSHNTTTRRADRLIQWAEAQRRTLQFDPPLLLPGEGPITVEQLAEIRHLTKDNDVSPFKNLGCGQARALLLFLREQQEVFTQDLIGRVLSRGGS